MEVKCDICWENVNLDSIKKVQNTFIKSNSGKISVRNILKTLFPIPVSFANVKA